MKQPCLWYLSNLVAFVSDKSLDVVQNGWLNLNISWIINKANLQFHERASANVNVR